MGRSTDKETRLSEQRKYRTWTAKQKIGIVLAGRRGDRSVKEVCREHQISDTLYYSWRDKLLEGGLEALAGKEERQGERELRRKVAELERHSDGRRTSWRSREKPWRAGSERARRPVPPTGRRGLRSRGGGARDAGEPAGALPDAQSEVAILARGRYLQVRLRGRSARCLRPDRAPTF
jgi:transposase